MEMGRVLRLFILQRTTPDFLRDGSKRRERMKALSETESDASANAKPRAPTVETA